MRLTGVSSAETIVELLRLRASLQPNRPVFSFLMDGEHEGRSLTYAELDRQARTIGSLLQAYGRGERVLLLYPPGPEFIAAFFGCLYGGNLAVPASAPDLDRPGRTVSRLCAIVKDAQTSIALTTSSLLKTVTALAAPAPELSAIRWLATDAEGDLAEEWWNPGTTRERFAYLQYTSGSTSAPKGVVVTHRNILQNSAYISNAWDYTPDSVSVMWVPHYHDDGLVHGIVQPVFGGFHAFFISPQSFVQQPARWLRAISRRQATHSGGPNFAYALCVRKIPAEQRGHFNLSTWRVAYNAAEPIHKQTLEQFAGAFRSCGFRWSSFYPAYGLAEATLLVTTRQNGEGPRFHTTPEAASQDRNTSAVRAEHPRPGRTVVSCGSPVGKVNIAIVHPELRTRCAEGEEGEVWLSDASVAHGYWNRPEDTEENFQAYLAETGEGPFLRTGDLGFRCENELFITGRLKDLIIIRGQNHYPQDIEWTVQESHPALRPGCCAAFSIESGEEERLVIVAEVQRSPEAVDAEAVRDAIRRNVSEQHGLHVYAVSLLKPGTILKTSSGKIQRRACRAGFLENTLHQIGGASDTPVFSQ